MGKISTPIRIRIQADTKLQTQRSTKVPIHYRENWISSWMIYRKNGIIVQIGSATLEKPIYGTAFPNPSAIIKRKKDSNQTVLDGRHLNSKTDQSSEFWPLDPSPTQLSRADKKYMSAFHHLCAYAHATLDNEPTKITGFSLEDKLLAFIRGFYGLKGLNNFFTKQVSLFFNDLIRQETTLGNFDDIQFMSSYEPRNLQLINQLLVLANKENPTLVFEKRFFMLLALIYLGHEIASKTVKSFQSENAALKKYASPTTEIELMMFSGSMKFFPKFLDKLD